MKAKFHVFTFFLSSFLFGTAASAEAARFTWMSKDSTPHSSNVLYFGLKLDDHHILANRGQQPNLNHICEYLGHRQADDWTTRDSFGDSLITHLVISGEDITYRLSHFDMELLRVIDTLSCLKR